MHEESFEESAGAAVERSVTLPADPDAVWEHLTDGTLLGEWLEGTVEISPRRGGSIALTPETGPVSWGTVEEVVPGRRIQWSWRTDDGLPTMVEVDLESVETGTLLTVRETLLPWTITGLEPQWLGNGPLEALLSAAA
jgi:uncharacterized protein YndB with AHSA1/START domain